MTTEMMYNCGNCGAPLTFALWFSGDCPKSTEVVYAEQAVAQKNGNKGQASSPLKE